MIYHGFSRPLTGPQSSGRCPAFLAVLDGVLAEHFDLLVLSLGRGFLARGGLAGMFTYKVLCLLTCLLLWVRESRTLLGDGVCGTRVTFSWRQLSRTLLL